MSAKCLAVTLHNMFTSTSDWRLSAGIGVVAASVMISGALAEQSQQKPTSDHQQLCKDLYNIYDTNMDEHYNKKNSAKTRQSYYLQAQAALSDFRKQGCKTKEMK